MDNLFNRKILFKATDTNLNTTIDITDLRIEFNINKDNKPQPNTAKFTIYNLSKDTMDFLSKKGINISFFGGYNKADSVLFIGQIAFVSHKYNGLDWVSDINCQDSVNGLNLVKVNKSFNGRVSLDTVLKYLISEMGLGIGLLKIPDIQFNNGIALSGFARDRIREYCKNENLSFSVQDGNVYIILISEKITNNIFTINAESGLVGSPVLTEKGVKLEILLNGNVKIGYQIKIDSQSVNGTFKIDTLTHNGSQFDGNFYTSIEALK